MVYKLTVNMHIAPTTIEEITTIRNGVETVIQSSDSSGGYNLFTQSITTTDSYELIKPIQIVVSGYHKETIYPSVGDTDFYITMQKVLGPPGIQSSIETIKDTKNDLFFYLNQKGYTTTSAASLNSYIDIVKKISPSYSMSGSSLSRGTFNGDELKDVTSIDSYGLAYNFYNCEIISNIDLSSLTSIGNYGMYHTFESSMSTGTSVVKTIDLSSLTSIGNYGMSGCFLNCSKISDIYFNSLTTTSFGSYTNQFDTMFSSGTNTWTTVTLHFPSNLETTISGLDGYPLFGRRSGKCVLSFDLPATS